MSSTDAEGRFRVLKREGAPAEITLSVMARGFTPPTQEKFAWGRHDIRIVMVRGKELVVFAVRAADGTPVEDYQLRVVPSDGGFNSMDREPRGKPPHKDGRVAVRGIAVGKHRILVSPKGSDLAIGAVPIEVGPNGAAPVTVRLAATEPRVVRVVKVAGGAPVGAKVQLVDPCGELWNEAMPLFAPSASSFSSGSTAIELATATTDANGECTLPVPGDRALALMLPGPGHAAVAVKQAVFPADGPLVVTVSSGATLRGKMEPATAWAEVMRRGGGDGVRERGRTLAPTLSLARGEGVAREQFPNLRTRHAVNPDGTFELTGIPPGRWNAFLSYVTHGSGGIHKQEPLGTVDLIDGEVTTITPDLSALLPGTLEALVLHNGAPLANTVVHFAPIVPRNPWPQAEASGTTGADGRVAVAVRSGQFAAIWYPPSGIDAPSVLRSSEVAVVRVGETTRQTFHIQSGMVKLRLVDSTGKPVSSVQVSLVDAAGNTTLGLGATSADGRVERAFSPGTFAASVLPKRLLGQKAMMEFARTVTDPSQWQAVMVSIGSITVIAGETTELELKLPADW
jgi:hypothetical protein